MSHDVTYSAEQLAALEPPGVYANQVFLNLIDGLIRISFGLKAGSHLRYTEAVTMSPGLALALGDLIDTYVKPAVASADLAAKKDTGQPDAEQREIEEKKRSDLEKLKEIRTFRTTPH